MGLVVVHDAPTYSPGGTVQLTVTRAVVQETSTITFDVSEVNADGTSIVDTGSDSIVVNLPADTSTSIQVSDGGIGVEWTVVSDDGVTAVLTGVLPTTGFPVDPAPASIATDAASPATTTPGGAGFSQSEGGNLQFTG